MKNLHRRALLAATFLASACSVLPDRPYQEVLRYTLEPRRQGEAWRGEGRRLLLVRTLRAPAALDVRGLRNIRPMERKKLISTPNGSHRWQKPPNRLCAVG